MPCWPPSRQSRPKRTIVIGGENAVSQRVRDRFRADHRIAGVDRYSTAEKVSATSAQDVEHSYIASGRAGPTRWPGRSWRASKEAPC